MEEQVQTFLVLKMEFFKQNYYYHYYHCYCLLLLFIVNVAHFFNGCKEFRNFYSRRHDRIVGKLFDEIKLISNARKKVYTNKLPETLLPERRIEKN